MIETKLQMNYFKKINFIQRELRNIFERTEK